MPEFLCAATIFLLVVMVVGHGMWVFLVWILRAISGSESSEPGKPCPHCGARYGVAGGRCTACGAVPYVPPGRHTSRDELQTTITHIQRLAQRGSIPLEQSEQLTALLKAEIDALTTRPLIPLLEPVAAAPAAPVSTAPALSATTPPPIPASAVLTAADVVDAVIVEAAPATIPVLRPTSAHPLDRPVVPAPAPPPRQPGKSLADMLQSFMEESNIRWVEILVSMVIVICSVGLVISLHSTLRQIPYSPAILFTLFTVSFHGAGLYTLRRWKLEAVSKTILIISLLLVPLTFCGAITLGDARPAGDILFWFILSAGTALFVWVTSSASRELVRTGAWPMALGVLGPSLGQVLAQHTPLTAENVWWLNAVFAAPLACFLTANGWQLIRARSSRQLSQARVIEILRVIGITSFALLVFLAIILVRTGGHQAALARLSGPLSLAAASVLALGLMIHRLTTAKRLSGWRTAGTALAVLAALVMLLLVALTWPQPELLLIVALLNATILALLGITAQLPVLYVASAACTATFLTIGLHLAGGHFADRTNLSLRLIQAALMGRTSLVLAVLAVLAAAFSAAAAWRHKAQRTDESLMLLLSGGGLAAAAIFIATFSGFVPIPAWPQDRDLAAGVLLAFAIALLAAGPLVQRAEVTSLGTGLLWMAFVQALMMNATIRSWLQSTGWQPDRPVLTATLIHGVLTAFLALFAAWRTKLTNALGQPLAYGSAISLVAAAPCLLWVRDAAFSTNAIMAAAAALGWLLLALAQRWKWGVSALQVMAALSAALAIAGLWHAKSPVERWFLTPQHLFAQTIAIGIAAMIWSAIRRASARQRNWQELLHAPWPPVDQALLTLAAVALPMIGFWLARPLVGWELGFGEQPPALAAALNSWGTLGFLGTPGRGWIAIAIIAAALLVALYERVQASAIVSLGVSTFASVWIAACHFESQVAAASAARWAAMVYAIVWAGLYLARQPIHAAAKALSALRWRRFPEAESAWLGGQSLILGGGTILVLTITAVLQNYNGATLHGPLAGSWFHAVGPTISYACPLAALVVILLAYSVHERNAAFALMGAAVAQLAVNLAFLLQLDPTMTAAARGVQWLQWNAIAAGAYAVVWQVLAPWITPTSAPATKKRIAEGMALIPLGVAALAIAVLIGGAAVAIFDEPQAPPRELTSAGAWLSYLALAFISVATTFLVRSTARLPALGEVAFWLGASLVPLLAATLHRYDRGGQWIAYHTLQAGWLAIALIACAAVYWYCRRPAQLFSSYVPHHASVAALASLVVVLAVRSHRFDPEEPWWSLASIALAGGTFAVLGLAVRRQPHAYLSTAAAGLFVFIFWTAKSTNPWLDVLFERRPYTVFAGFECFFLALVAVSGFWLAIEIAYQRRQDQSFDPRSYLPRVHLTAITLLLPLYCTYRLGLAAFFGDPMVVGYEAIAILATLALGSLTIACLWDRRAILAIVTIYVGSFAAQWLIVGLLRPWLHDTESRTVAITLAAAAHVALSGQLWSYGANLAAIGTRLGISDPVAGLVRTEKWLPPLTAILTVVLSLICLAFVLRLDQLEQRVAAGFGPALCAWGLVCLAQEHRRDRFQLASLLVAGLSAIYVAWAQIDPDLPAVTMTRVFRLLMVLAALTAVYGLVLPRFLLLTGSWNAATRKAGYVAAVSALATFGFTLALEVQLYLRGQQAAISDIQVAAIAVVLLALIAGLISLALLPGRDPLVLSEQGRQTYVYAAEATAALLFAHLYVCRPEWFDGILRRYWPFIVMGIAFAGVGAAEFFSRRGIRVLAEPLARSGAALPLLPVLGWWVDSAHTDYALLLLVTGLLYLMLSYTQRSWAAMLAAVVSGNGALWALLTNTDLSFVTNPQLWLIPPALSALVAAQLNRHKLTPQSLTGIRYAAASVIYVSSTSEIFTRGLAGSFWAPMILLTLSVVGVLLGIAFRVRAFLFLGTSFTFLALVAMVRQASQSIHHTWPWWVFGISLGVGALILRGIFEKQRDEITRLIARLRQWEQ